jgi:hypothetical protein
MPLLLDQNVTVNAMLPYISPVEDPQRPAKGCIGYPLNNFFFAKYNYSPHMHRLKIFLYLSWHPQCTPFLDVVAPPLHISWHKCNAYQEELTTGHKFRIYSTFPFQYDWRNIKKKKKIA